MFNCGMCKKAIGPKVSPVVLVDQVPCVHEYPDPEDNTKTLTSPGMRIVKETKVCHECAGVKAPSEKKEDYTGVLASAKGYFSHTKGCQRDNCTVCARIRHIMEGLPLHVVSQILEG